MEEFHEVLLLTPVWSPSYYFDPPRKWRQWIGLILLSVCSERCLATNFKVVVKTDEKMLEATLWKQVPKACRESGQCAGPFWHAHYSAQVPKSRRSPATSHRFPSPSLPGRPSSELKPKRGFCLPRIGPTLHNNAWVFLLESSSHSPSGPTSFSGSIMDTWGWI